MTETSEFPDMLRRLLNAWAVRVATGDTYDLREMVDVLGIASPAVAMAVKLNQAEPDAWPWSMIAADLGITRQAAHKRWGRRAQIT